MTASTLIDVIADAAFAARNSDEAQMGEVVTQAVRTWLVSDEVVTALTQRMLDNFATTYPIPPNLPLDAKHPSWRHIWDMAREAQALLADAIERGMDQ